MHETLPMTPKRLLVIDDDADIRCLLEVILVATEGWQVSLADSGAAGLQMAAADRPDAILLDVMMPVMDGIETLERLRDDAATAAIPVIFFTAKAQEEFARLLERGVQGVIGKPFEPGLLGKEIRGLLGWD